MAVPQTYGTTHAIYYDTFEYLNFHEVGNFMEEKFIDDNTINGLWLIFERQLLCYFKRMKSHESKIPMCINSFYMWEGLASTKTEVDNSEYYNSNNTKRSLRRKSKTEINFDRNFEVYKQAVCNDVWTKDIVFIPYNICQLHWILFVLNFNTFEYDVWDSCNKSFKRDHAKCWKNVENYFIAKYKSDNNGASFPFKFTKAKDTGSPGPQQPGSSNDCALYVVWNMVWLSFGLNLPSGNKAYGFISAKEYQQAMTNCSNTLAIRKRAFAILYRGSMFTAS